MIIIAGDSWGVGEWSLDYINTHTGLQQYLEDDGHTVLNVSVGGSSLFSAYNELSRCLYILKALKLDHNITNVFLFQTEWHREANLDITKDTEFNIEYIHRSLSWHYNRFSEIAQKYNITIGLIGGAGDVIWLDRFANEYPGLYIACQSMINLCINDNHRIDNPLYSLIYPAKLIETLNNISSKNKQFLIDQMELTQNRSKEMKQLLYYFGPDSIHANRNGHKKLYNFLKEQQILT
jgi:lysophospholipase L1-like esterase